MKIDVLFQPQRGHASNIQFSKLVRSSTYSTSSAAIPRPGSAPALAPLALMSTCCSSHQRRPASSSLLHRRPVAVRSATLSAESTLACAGRGSSTCEPFCASFCASGSGLGIFAFSTVQLTWLVGVLQQSFTGPVHQLVAARSISKPSCPTPSTRSKYSCPT